MLVEFVKHLSSVMAGIGESEVEDVIAALGGTREEIMLELEEIKVRVCDRQRLGIPM